MITLSSLPRAIAHIDCDAFFASVEQSLNPKLKGRPVITGQERGIAASMSYEAKACGVVRGMRLREVKRVCPGCVLLPNDYEAYSLYSKRIFGIIRRFTPDVEEYSIDEAFADLTGLRRLFRTSYENIALKIKEAVVKETGVTVSVGLSLTKTLAKICSKYRKPAGFTCVKGYDLHEFLQNIPAEKVCGFGNATVELLAKHGVSTCLDYANRPEHFAKKLLGKIGIELWHELRGDAVYTISKEAVPIKTSISKTKTFTPASDNKDFVKAQVLRNVESAFIKLRRHRLRTKTIAVYITDSDFKSQGLAADLTRLTSSTQEVVPVVSKLFEHIFHSHRKYRRTGVVLTGLASGQEEQFDLFEDAVQIQSLKRVSHCIDEVNARYGKHTLHLAATHYVSSFNQHLGERGDMAKRKTNLLKGETFRRRLAIPFWDLEMSV